MSSTKSWLEKQLGVSQRAPQPARVPVQQASSLPPGTIPVDVWHGVPTNQTTSRDAIRQWRGQAGAQRLVGPCPNCGSPDGYVSSMPRVDEGAIVNSKLAEPGKVAGQCFYCGYRAGGRGMPSPAMTATVSGGVRNARGPMLDATAQTGRYGGLPLELRTQSAIGHNPKAVDRSLVGR